MANVLVLLSHPLTDEQIEELRDISGDAGDIIRMPEELQAIWKQIDIDDSYRKKRMRIFDWLSRQSTAGDYILVQGEWGTTYAVVDWCFKFQRIPIFAFAERRVIEEQTGSKEIIKKSVFVHRRFARYDTPWLKIVGTK